MNAENAAGDGWIEWEGGGCPVPAGTMVEVRLRDGSQREGLACNLYYWHQSALTLPGDIVAYRVKLPAPADVRKLADSLESASRWIRELVVQGDKLRANERQLLDRLEALTADKQRLTDELIAARQAAAAVRRGAEAGVAAQRLAPGLYIEGDKLTWIAADPPCSAQCDEEMPR